MPGRNDPVLDSGFPQVDHPGRPRGWLRSAFVWVVPLFLGLSMLSWGSLDDFLDGAGLPLGLILFGLAASAGWWWWTRFLSCPRCGRRIRRAGADSDCAYYPCSACRVMWRSSRERLPTIDDDDLL